MKKHPFAVLAACVDARSGKHFAPGDLFAPAPTVDQAKRLVGAGCLPEAAIEEAQRVEDNGGVDLAEISRDQLNHDGLFDKSLDELAEIARSEGVVPSDDETKAHIVAAIRGHRARQAARPDAFAIEQRTEAGQAAARAADAAATSVGVVDGLDAMAIDELRELAKVETIDLGEAKKKAEIVAAIREARAAKAR